METKFVYRVWYGDYMEKEAFFIEKDAAEVFAKLESGYMDTYKWEIQIKEEENAL